MMSVMLSLQPKWCAKIFNKEKRMEIRKSRPSIPTPFEVFVYCTKGGRPLIWNTPCATYADERLMQTYGWNFEEVREIFGGAYNGKVIGSFICDRIIDIKYNEDDCGNYWHEWDDECDICDMCLSYEELEKYLGGASGYGWHITEPKLFNIPRDISEFFGKSGRQIERAFQSWGYCYGGVK